LIPYKHFTFAKIWLLYAKFEIRNKNLSIARKSLGKSLGMCPKVKLFRGYIDLEIQLREFDRCRILYQKFLEFDPENCVTWMKFAELETLLGEIDRARAIYELAVNMPRLDMPEFLWKAYIDFEVGLNETEKARELYERLLEKTLNVKVWKSYAQFEMSSSEEGNVALTRRVYVRANQSLRGAGEEERISLLESWQMFETQNGDEKSLENVVQKMPKKKRKRQKIQAYDGTEEGWKESVEYIFPEDEATKPNLKLYEMAKAWKKQKEKAEEEGEEIVCCKKIKVNNY
jgi:crooked neck